MVNGFLKFNTSKLKSETFNTELKTKNLITPRRGGAGTAEDTPPVMFDACVPLAPCTTSKFTFCPSLSVLQPFILMAEQWANKSSPPTAGVIKPNPGASLNPLPGPVDLPSPADRAFQLMD